jgi:phosphoketolase
MTRNDVQAGYLLDNPLVKKPLGHERIKPRLLEHWGTTPGQDFYISGPRPRRPGFSRQHYLEGTYSEIYPNVSQNEAGLKKSFKQFSFPGGIPSHVAPVTPGSIHEGGELAYSLSHPILSWRASSATVKPRLARWRRRASSYTRSMRPRVFHTKIIRCTACV